MNNKLLLVIVLIFFSSAFFTEVNAVNSTNSTLTWKTFTVLTISFSSSTCYDSVGSKTIKVKVFNTSTGNSPQTDANVSVKVQYPNNDINHLNFSNLSDGNYDLNFNFNAVGTYKFDVNARTDGNGNAQLRKFVFVDNYDFNISFSNNNETLTAGTTGTITNVVANTDGNFFVGIDGNTTIKYPNGSNFVLNQTMTNVGNGQYTYAFTVPSTPGTYDVNSTFACASKTKSDSNGHFIVSSQSSDSQGQGNNQQQEDEEQEEQEELEEEIKKPFDGIVKGHNLSDEINLGIFTPVIATIQNNGIEKNDYLLTVIIRQALNKEFSVVKQIANVAAGQELAIEFDKGWLPLTGGSHTIEMTLTDGAGRNVYSKTSNVINLPGSFNYDLKMECLEESVKPLENISSNIVLFNRGNYYEDVLLEWYIEDNKGRIIAKDSENVSVYVGERKSLIKDFIIPEGTPAGTYLFIADVNFNNLVTGESCTFRVLPETEVITEPLVTSATPFIPEIWFWAAVILIALFLIFVILSIIKLFKDILRTEENKPKESSPKGKLQNIDEKKIKSWFGKQGIKGEKQVEGDQEKTSKDGNEKIKSWFDKLKKI